VKNNIFTTRCTRIFHKGHKAERAYVYGKNTKLYFVSSVFALGCVPPPKAVSLVSFVKILVAFVVKKI
jgi:hypothetical protein